MKNYLVYTTVTTWNEPPRARHQVSNELKNDGVVYFVERNKVGRPRIEVKRAEDNIVVITPYFPVLYKVRYRTPLLNEVYHNWLLKQIKLLKIEFEFVVSFDYTAPAIHRFFNNVIFYCADDNVGFGNFNPFFINQYHTRTEKLVAKGAKLCVCTSEYMGKKIGNYNANTHVIPLGAPVIDYDNIQPPDTSKPLPVLGLVGYLDSNLDMQLLYEILDKFHTIFIGPVSDANRKKLARFNKAEFVGPKTGEALHKELSRADVCIAPYDPAKLNNGATPNKMWLYLALGKPSVITNMPNIVNWDLGEKLVYRCNNKDFIQCCIDAYKNDSYAHAMQRQQLARNNSWKNRIETMKALYYETIAEKTIASNAMVA